MSVLRDNFIRKANVVHNNRYDYSKVEYVNNKVKVVIGCTIHGDFLQTPNSHLSGHGCPKCAQEYKNRKKVIPTDEFIRRAREKHGGKYDYSKVVYKTCNDDVCIICPKHGDFWQKGYSHLAGRGCMKCANEKRDDDRRLGVARFILLAKEIHGVKYDYSLIDRYMNNRYKMPIVCEKHGTFWQNATHHLQGEGCPKCNRSRLERDVIVFLENSGIKYEEQKKFDWLGNYTLDFYLPEYNKAIECQGIQHFKGVDLFGGDEQFMKQVEWDKEKRSLCESQGIEIIYYTTDYLKRKYDNGNLVSSKIPLEEMIKC